MIRKIGRSLTPGLLSIAFLACVSPHRAAGQSASVQGPQGVTRSVHPVSLAHLYWHFLTYQNHLDSKDAEASAQGKGGSGPRKMLQRGLGFKDDDYAPVRISSVRLTSELKALDARAAAIRADGPSAANQKKMMALTVERETDIRSEISYLKRTLTPGQLRMFEAFLVKLFSPSNAVSQLPRPNGQPAVPAVQK